MTDEELIKFVTEHPDPVVKASEVAAEFGYSDAGASHRLNKLVEEGTLLSKRFGSSAKGYWLPDSASDS